MYEQVEKPKENKSRAVANSVAQKKSDGKQGSGFVDNRPKKIALQNRDSTSQPFQKYGAKSGLSDNLKLRTKKLSGYSIPSVIQRSENIDISGSGTLSVEDAEYLLFTTSMSQTEQKQLVAKWICKHFKIEGFHISQLANRIKEKDISDIKGNKKFKNALISDYINDFKYRGAAQMAAVVKEPDFLLKEDLLHRKDLRKFLNPAGHEQVIGWGQGNRKDKGETPQLLSDLILNGVEGDQVPHFVQNSGSKYKKATDVNKKIQSQVQKTTEGVVITLLGNTDQDGSNWGRFNVNNLEGMIGKIIIEIGQKAANPVMLSQLNLLGCQTSKMAIELQKRMKIPVVSYIQHGKLLEQYGREGTNKTSGALVTKDDKTKKLTPYKQYLTRRLIYGTTETLSEFITKQEEASKHFRGPRLDEFYEASTVKPR